MSRQQDRRLGLYKTEVHKRTSCVEPVGVLLQSAIPYFDKSEDVLQDSESVLNTETEAGEPLVSEPIFLRSRLLPAHLPSTSLRSSAARTHDQEI